MNVSIEAILEEIDSAANKIEINFEDDAWRNNIPSEPGWYFISTNAPPKVLSNYLRSVAHPAHADISATIQYTRELQKSGIAILQSGNEDYVVYNGEAENLNARAREHVKGHPKTYCLGLSDNVEVSKNRWLFCYVPMSACKTISNRDKMTRTVIEQAWRAKHGWPILCKK